MTNQFIHKDLAAGRWSKLSFAEQMGNIGSEVGRAIARMKHGESEQKERALTRAFELLDLTVANQKNFFRFRELLRAREVLADFFYGDNEYHSSTENLEKYFYQFNWAARKDR